VSEARSQRFAVWGRKRPAVQTKSLDPPKRNTRCREPPDSPPRAKAASLDHESGTDEAQVLVVSV